MSSNVHDLLVWLDALFHHRVISKGSLHLMQTWVDASDNGRHDSIVGYGLGLAHYSIDDNTLSGHPGECFAFWDPKTDITYGIVYNLSRQDNPAGKDILRSMLSTTSL